MDVKVPNHLLYALLSVLQKKFRDSFYNILLEVVIWLEHVLFHVDTLMLLRAIYSHRLSLITNWWLSLPLYFDYSSVSLLSQRWSFSLLSVNGHVYLRRVVLHYWAIQKNSFGCRISIRDMRLLDGIRYLRYNIIRLIRWNVIDNIVFIWRIIVKSLLEHKCTIKLQISSCVTWLTFSFTIIEESLLGFRFWRLPLCCF